MNTLKKFASAAVVAGLIALPAAAASPETQALYKAKCTACHGADGMASAIGKKIGARDFTMPEVMKQKDGELVVITTNGKNKMPAFKDKLKEAEIRDLVEYVKELVKKK